MTLLGPVRIGADPARRSRAGVAGCALLVPAVGVSVLVGSHPVSPLALVDAASPEHAILAARLPRTALAVLVGAALALAGACLQGLTRNPLADPGLLGVNAGASFAMVVAVTTFGVSSLQGYVWCAFAGAAVAAVLVHTIAAFGPGGSTPAKLVLAGTALSAGVASWTSGVLLTHKQTFDVFRGWQVGTLGGRGWDVVAAGAPFLAVGATLALAGARTLDTLALGDDLARGLGRRVGHDRLLIGVAAVLLAGTSTALAGPIAFVGLIVPHAVRALVGGANATVLPLSMAYGATLVLLADTVGRVVLPPTEVQAGIMTAVVGVPVFVWFLRHGRMAGL